MKANALNVVIQKTDFVALFHQKTTAFDLNEFNQSPSGSSQDDGTQRT